MRHPNTLPLSMLFLAAAAVPSGAQNVVTLVLEGDTIPGNGKVTFIDNIAVNNAGQWMAEVRTDNPSTAINKVVLLDGVVVLTKGQAMPAPAGSTLTGFDAMTLNIAGDPVYNFGLGGMSAATDGGVYWNDKLVIQEGDVTTATGFQPGSVYVEIYEVLNSSSNQLVVIAEMNDPTVTFTPQRAIVILDIDSLGNLVGETLVARTGDNLTTGSLAQISDFKTTAHFWSFNDMGSVMYHVSQNTGTSANDEAIVVGQQVVLQEQMPSVIPGRLWDDMSTPEMDHNNVGDWIVSAVLDGSTADNQILVKNNAKFVQKFDPLPGMPQFNIQSFGSGPVEIGDNGKVLWFADWDDPMTTQDTGLFVDQTLIVQEGVTTAGANVIAKLVGLIDGYHMAPAGNYVIFEGKLDNGKKGAFLMNLAGGGSPGTPTCFGDGTGGTCPCGNIGASGAGCANSAGSGAVLGATGSPSVGANNITYQGSGLPLGRIALLASGGSASSLMFGDGILCIGNGWTSRGALIASSGGTANWSGAALPGGAFTPGQTYHFQILFRDPAGPCGSAFGSSSAFQVAFTQ